MTVTISAMRAAGLSNDQILAVLEAAEAQAEARAAARRSAGAERTARWRANKAVTKSDAVTSQTSQSDVTESDGVTSQSVTNVTPNKERKVSIPSKERNNIYIYPEDFEKFWRAYPERKGSNPKHPAHLKFASAVRSGAKPEEIISGAKGYAAAESSKIKTEFIMQAKTWLNQRCWEGYQPRAPTVSPEEAARLRELYEQKQRDKW